ncbi:MAG: replication restart helicase PriA [Thermoleophilia bacterium]
MTVVRVTPLLGVRGLGRESFDYTVPAEQCDDAALGTLVLVPFGRRKVDGVVTALGASGEVAPSKLRPIAAVGSHRLPTVTLDLAEAISKHYLAPLGACLQAAVPGHLLPSRVRPPCRRVAWVKPAAESAVDLTRRQSEALAAVPPDGLTITDLCAQTGVGRSVVEALVSKGALARFLEAAPGPGNRTSNAYAGEDPPVSAPESASSAALILSVEQEAALGDLGEALRARRFSERLLWGVTGSGKTEVYLRLLQEVARGGGGAIVLVPEIALTVQLIERLRSRLGETVAVLHSGLPAGARAREYDRVADGAARVVVGARSAVFAPVNDLRLIVLDEAHDTSYKQEEEPRYDARWVARWLGRRNDALVVEGTATPSVESFRLTRRPLELRSRPTGARLPEVEVVDMRRQGGEGVLAPISATALREVLVSGEQAVVLLNRRGYSAFLQCEECGDVVMCPDCDISLTFHRSARALVCHHCGLRVASPAVCPACASAALRRGSPGTERVVEELLRMVPRDRLFRLDSDVATSGVRVIEILGRFSASTPGVLVGTQMVAKGHDYPMVTLVLVADADTGLYAPDFRASERTFQLLTQVAGRAGRADRPGRVLVQSWNPDVDCVRMAVTRDIVGFYREELAVREHLGYPPFRDLIKLVLSGAVDERVDAGGRHLIEKLRTALPDVRGPARLPRIRGLSRRQIVVADTDGDRARRVVGRALQRFRGPYARRGLDIVVDVDPQWFA